MNIRVATFRLGICAALITSLCGFGVFSLKPLLMHVTARIDGSPDYALVTFLNLSAGDASVNPLRGDIQIWDGDTFVGWVDTHQALQYKAAPGNHVFVLYARTIGGINARLLAGNSYYVNIKRGLLIDPSLEAIKPTDSRIDPWPVDLKVIAMDTAAWESQQQKAGCNWPATRKVSPRLCRAVELQRAHDIAVIQDGACAAHPFDALQTTCKYLALGPEDGR